MKNLKTVSNILRLKEHKKEGLESEMRQVNMLMKQEQERLDALERLFADTAAAYGKKQLGVSVSAQELELYSNYISQVGADMDAQRRVISQRTKEQIVIQDALIETYRDKKLMETLQNRIIRENVKMEEQSDQKEMDFLFLLGSMRDR